MLQKNWDGFGRQGGTVASRAIGTTLDQFSCLRPPDPGDGVKVATHEADVFR